MVSFDDDNSRRRQTWSRRPRWEEISLIQILTNRFALQNMTIEMERSNSRRRGVGSAGKLRNSNLDRRRNQDQLKKIQRGS